MVKMINLTLYTCYNKEKSWKTKQSKKSATQTINHLLFKIFKYYIYTCVSNIEMYIKVCKKKKRKRTCQRERLASTPVAATQQLCGLGLLV